MKNKIKTRIGFYIELNEEEKKMVDLLKSKYAINISQMIKNHLRETFGRLEDGKKINGQK